MSFALGFVAGATLGFVAGVFVVAARLLTRDL